MAGASAFLFVAHTSAVAWEIRAKYRIWDNVLQDNVRLLMADSLQLLDVDSGPRHIYCIMEEVVSEYLIALLATLWSETHTLVADLLSLVQHNNKERRGRVDWAAEYEILLMYSCAD